MTPVEITLIVIGAILLLSFLSSIYTVPEKSAAVVERFGKYQKISRSGLQFKVPFIDAVKGRPNLKVREIKVHVETKTSDDVFVEVVVSVQYQIKDDLTWIRKAFYELDNPEGQIESYVFDSVRSEVPLLKLDDVFSEKDKIADAIKRELSGTMGNYGFVIIKAPVTDINPDSAVKDAMNRINAADRLKQAAYQEAEAEKIRVVKAAEARKEAQQLEGEGIAAKRQAIVFGLQESVHDFQDKIKGVDSRGVVNMVMVTEYLDMLRDISKGEKGMNTLFIPTGSDGYTDISGGMLQALFAAGQMKEGVQ